jgi:hypothetical protein
MITQPRNQYPESTSASWYPVTLISGQNIVLVGVTGCQIKVYSVFLSAPASTNITLQDGNNNFTGAMPMTGLAFDTQDKPFICSVNNSFNITANGPAAGAVFATIG